MQTRWPSRSDFLHWLRMNDIDSQQDLTITCLDMSQVSTMLASGKIKYVVLNEPNYNVAVLNAKKNGMELNRVLN